MDENETLKPALAEMAHVAKSFAVIAAAAEAESNPLPPQAPPEAAVPLVPTPEPRVSPATVTLGAFVSFATNAYASTSSSGAALAAIDLTGIAALQNIGPGTNVTFRLVNFGASGSTGTWYIYNVANSTAPDFSISGTIAPLTVATAAPPVLTLSGFTNNQLSFTLTGSVGTNYVIEASTNLAGNFWTPVRTSAAPVLFSEPATNARQFYRGKLLP